MENSIAVLKPDMQLSRIQREEAEKFLVEFVNADEDRKNELKAFSDYEVMTIVYEAKKGIKERNFAIAKRESVKLSNNATRTRVKLAKKMGRKCYVCGGFDKSHSLDYKYINMPIDSKGLAESRKREAPDIKESYLMEDGSEGFRWRHPTCQPTITADEVIYGAMLDGDEANKIREFAEYFEVKEAR